MTLYWKPCDRAYHGTDLELILRNREIDTRDHHRHLDERLLETTAREANMSDYKLLHQRRDRDLQHPRGDRRPESADRARDPESAFAQIEDTASMIRKLEAQRSAFAA